MRCKICGTETTGEFCHTCKEEIDQLTAQIKSTRGKINLDFDKKYIYDD